LAPASIRLASRPTQKAPRPEFIPVGLGAFCLAVEVFCFEFDPPRIELRANRAEAKALLIELAPKLLGPDPISSGVEPKRIGQTPNSHPSTLNPF
jgi:hypothetical protein